MRPASPCPAPAAIGEPRAGPQPNTPSPVRNCPWHLFFIPALAPDVLDRWAIDPTKRVERFRPEQAAFLARHRELFAQKARRA